MYLCINLFHSVVKLAQTFIISLNFAYYDFINAIFGFDFLKLIQPKSFYQLLYYNKF